MPSRCEWKTWARSLTWVLTLYLFTELFVLVSHYITKLNNSVISSAKKGKLKLSGEYDLYYILGIREKNQVKIFHSRPCPGI